jgi:hypothetical protein
MHLLQRHGTSTLAEPLFIHFSRVYGRSTVIPCLLVGQALYYACILQIDALGKSRIIFRAAPEKLVCVVPAVLHADATKVEPWTGFGWAGFGRDWSGGVPS